MGKLELDVPNLLGEGVFQTQIFNGVWAFTQATGDDVIASYDEGLKGLGEYDSNLSFLNWLEQNSLDDRRRFLFHGTNGAACRIFWSQEKLISKKDAHPPMKDERYQLPFLTECKYRRELKVIWQPKAFDIPPEIIGSLRYFGYTPRKE